MITGFFSSIVSMEAKLGDAIFSNYSVECISSFSFPTYRHNCHPILIIAKELAILISMLGDS